jgi:hypothetical protein
MSQSAMKCVDGRSADFQVCRAAGVPTCGWSADLEIGDTAGLETCATNLHPPAVGMNSFATETVAIPEDRTTCGYSFN